RNVASAARAPSVPRGERSTWTPEELSQFLASAREHRLYAAFVLLATTGMRRGEVCGLRWADVDLEGAVLAVVQTLTTVNGAAVVSSPKTLKSRRRVSLDGRTVDVLTRM